MFLRGQPSVAGLPGSCLLAACDVQRSAITAHDLDSYPFPRWRDGFSVPDRRPSECRSHQVSDGQAWPMFQEAIYLYMAVVVCAMVADAILYPATLYATPARPIASQSEMDWVWCIGPPAEGTVHAPSAKPKPTYLLIYGADVVCC